MSKKKSYMKNNTIIKEGFFDNLLQIFKVFPQLRKNSKIKKDIQSLNKKVETLETAVNKVLSMGPEKIIVKFGSKGARYFSSNEHISIGVYPVSKAIDPTGAGDVFGGGFVSGLADGLSVYDSMKRGTALASFCIEDFGVMRLLRIEPDELEKRINSIN